jgi:hypothetical protein
MYLGTGTHSALAACLSPRGPQKFFDLLEGSGCGGRLPVATDALSGSNVLFEDFTQRAVHGAVNEIVQQ